MHVVNEHTFHTAYIRYNITAVQTIDVEVINLFCIINRKTDFKFFLTMFTVELYVTKIKFFGLTSCGTEKSQHLSELSSNDQ